jgi:hypothetical protein
MPVGPHGGKLHHMRVQEGRCMSQGLSTRSIGVEDYRNPREMRRGPVEQLQPLASYRRFVTAESSRIAFGPGNVFHQTNGGRVTAPGKDNRDGLRCLLQRARRHSAPGDDHVGRERDELHRGRPQSICIGNAETPLDLQVAFNPTELGQRLAQRGPNRLEPRIAVIIGIQPTEQLHAPVRLRARRERPSRRAAEQCDELAPPHGGHPKARDHGSKYSSRSGPCIADMRPPESAIGFKFH